MSTIEMVRIRDELSRLKRRMDRLLLAACATGVVVGLLVGTLYCALILPQS